jgi:hypothetical protein
MSELKDKLKHKLKSMSISRKTEHANCLRLKKLEEDKKKKKNVKNIEKEIAMIQDAFEKPQVDNYEF